MPTNDLPEPTPGQVLAEKRKAAGFSQQAVADRIGVHRLTLTRKDGWEHSPQLPSVKVARYLRALDELADQVLA